MASSDANNECTSVPHHDNNYPSEAAYSDETAENDVSGNTSTVSLSAGSAVSLPHSPDGQNYERSMSEESDVPDPMKCVLCYQVLLDPVSLSCGHTFCQVCLVKLKMSSPSDATNIAYNAYAGVTNNSECPMCRKSWVDIPSVNISFREILEEAQPRKLARRRAQLSPEEIQALTDQKLDTSSTTTPQAGAQAADSSIKVITKVVCTWIIGFLAIAVSFLLFLVFKGVGGGFVTKLVSQWSTDDVMKWMSIQGETIQQDCKEVFERERIDGPHLFLLTNETLVGLNITRQFTIESLLVSINRLKKDEYVHPTSFTEFYTAYPVQTVMLASSFRTFPHSMFLYLFLFHYYEMYLAIIHPFQSTEISDEEGMVQQDTSWLKMLTELFEVLVLPQVAIGIFAYGWVGGHPILCCLVWLHCLISFKKDVDMLLWYRRVWRNLPLFFKDTVVSLLIFNVFWAVLSLVLSVFPVILLNYWAVVIFVIDSFIQPIVKPAVRIIENTIRGAH